MTSIDLEILIGPGNENGLHPVVTRWEDPRDISRPAALGWAKFDVQTLPIVESDSRTYGEKLTAMLFEDPRTLDAFRKAQETADLMAQHGGGSLRVRLAIGLDVSPDVHSLRWETLRSPLPPGKSLTTQGDVFFSRFLPSDRDWTVESPRAQQDLKALVVIANPKDVGRFKPGGRSLAPIVVEDWLKWAVEDMGGDIKVESLASGGLATLEGMFNKLREDFDILYLICHGGLIENEPRLWLEKPDGSADVASGLDFIRGMSELDAARKPRLTVLCSCQSAGPGGEPLAGDWGVLAALGPRLALEGSSAVLAMQGKVGMTTARAFLRTFFKELQADGLIDRAVAVARSALSRDPDYWMPALFMRLKSGNIRWYSRGFLGEDGFKRWSGLITEIQNGKCVPVVGGGVHESLLGSRTELARAWADQHHFPMFQARDDFPQVAQYLAVTQSPDQPRYELERHFCRQLIRRHKASLPADLVAAYREDRPVKKGLLDQLLNAAWGYTRSNDPNKPNNAYDILARLPFSIYLAATPDGLLGEAIKQAPALSSTNKTPTIQVLDWRDDRAGLSLPESIEPNEDQPLVCHLLGQLGKWELIPMTEDDYFAYLTRFGEQKAANPPAIPPVVQAAIAGSSLLFLGFRLDDWGFRSLLHAFQSFQNNLSKKRIRVTAQINPEESRFGNADSVREYLESYFQSKNIFVYWGRTEDFLQELWDRWREETTS